MGIGIDADIGCPGIIVAIADSYVGSFLVVEGSVKDGAVFGSATLHIDLSFILHSTFGYLLDDLRVGGLDHLLAKDDLNDLLRRIFLVHAGVAVELHLQLNHATQI